MRDGRNLIVISQTYAALPEKGEAIRVDKEGNVIARFIDGNLDSSMPAQPNDEPTLTPAS